MYIPECRIAYHHKDGRVYSGNLKAGGLRARVFDRSGEISVTIDPPEPIRLVSFTMSFHWTCEADERFFMNGFRSDSPCRERSRDNRAALLPSGLRKYLRVSAAAGLFSKYDINNGSPMGVSYCYFRTARNVYRLAASDDESGGYTVFQYDERDGVLYVSKDVEGVEIRPGEYRLMGIRIYDGDGDQVFGDWLAQLGVKPMEDKGFRLGYCTAHLGSSVDAESVKKAASDMSILGEEADLMAVYSGWQRSRGDWEPKGSAFPGGMGEVAEAIHKSGRKAALWFAPFAADRRSDLLRQHPDWALKNKSGQTVVSPMDHELAALDLGLEEVRDLVRQTVRKITGEWGFDVLICGDLYVAGLIPQKGRSRAGKMQDAMLFLRETVGDTPIIAADVPLMPAFGLVEYCLLSAGVQSAAMPAKVSVRAVEDAVSADRSECDFLYRRQLQGRAWNMIPREVHCRYGGTRVKKEIYLNRIPVRRAAGGLTMVYGDLTRCDGEFTERLNRPGEDGTLSIRRVFDKDRHVFADCAEDGEVTTIALN